MSHESASVTPLLERMSRSHVLVGLLAIAATVLLVGLFVVPRQALGGLLVGALFVVTLLIGVALFVAIQGAANARWWYPLRREIMTVAQPLLVPVAALSVALVAGLAVLYPWVGDAAGDAALEHAQHVKGAWLNVPFFLLRAAIILLVWIVVTRRLLACVRRVRPDAEDSAPGLARASIVFLIVFGVTITVAAIDWGMSLEPTWYSTMYGVYLWSGTLLGGIAVVIVTALRRESSLSASVTHDLGKLLFAFACFWAYIWFCQYMLIWYANIPEETSHYAARLTDGWGPLFVLNAGLNFVVPFLVLLSARAKRQRSTLRQVAFAVIAGRFLDLYLFVGPTLGPAPTFPVYAVAASVGVLALTALLASRFALIESDLDAPPAPTIEPPRLSPHEPTEAPAR